MNKYETNYITKKCKKNKNKDTWIIKENTHEAIIEKEKYDKVQEIKAKKQAKTKVKHEFLLKDLVYCGHCKRRLQYKIYKSANKKKFSYESSGFNCSLFYKKRCKNSTYIREKDLNEIVKCEVAKRLSLIEIDNAMTKLIDYYKENSENMQKIKEYKKEQEKLERKKSILYKEKCEQYITVEEFKTEYTKAKEKIQNYDDLIKKLTKGNDEILDKKKVKEIVEKFKSGVYISNEFLKEIINRIEIYSKNKIVITYKL